jgi:hypothetical protein
VGLNTHPAAKPLRRRRRHLQALLSTGFKMPERGILFSAQESLLEALTPAAFELGRLGFSLYATQVGALAWDQVACDTFLVECWTCAGAV